MGRRAFSGIQPTGRLHIGNYVGAISQWVARQGELDDIYCVVDLHAITVPEEVEPARLAAETREVAALVIACGIDPERSPLFVQSHVTEHAELAWLLDCVTPVSWLQSAAQYRAKAAAQAHPTIGLLDYPTLMAADILLYDTEVVPVGDDQTQHVEIARDIAARFNRLYGETFVLPRPLLRDVGARIMGLDDAAEKMSKSIARTRPGHAIGLLDPPERVRALLARAVTDSGDETRFERASPGVRNLLVLYEALSGETRARVEERFAGHGYAFLKREVAELVIAALTPIQERARALLADTTELDRLLARGAERVRPIAEATLRRARAAVGLVPRLSHEPVLGAMR